MANRAVFLDRDNTLIDDPGYLSDPGAVRLLPGVDLALKALAQAGFRLVVVTNQSAVARGLLTEQKLREVHDEISRRLAERGAHLDAIYYCPYHPDGTVEQYALDSELRKPRPGMLLKAAEELDVDLAESWMVGDSPRDIEAGERAGCRTVRVRPRAAQMSPEEAQIECTPDFTVRHLADAARVILRETGSGGAAEAPEAAGEPGDPAAPPPANENISAMDDRQVRQEILRYVRQLARADAQDDFSLTKVLAGVCQILAVLALLYAAIAYLSREPLAWVQLWATGVVALQLMALTFFTMHRANR